MADHRRGAKSESFPICVLGQDPFGPALDTIVAGETIGGKSGLGETGLETQDAVSAVFCI